MKIRASKSYSLTWLRVVYYGKVWSNETANKICGYRQLEDPFSLSVNPTNRQLRKLSKQLRGKS